MMRMRVEPICRSGLIDLERKAPYIARLYRPMWATVNYASYQKPVPMHGRDAVKGVLDGHLHFIATADADDRPEHGRRVAVCRGQLSLHERVSAGGDAEIYCVPDSCRINDLRYWQGGIEPRRATDRISRANGSSRDHCRTTDRKLPSGE
jgi:hypothetical protein